MAKRVLYQIAVKPTGFLASWRYGNVVIDDQTYVITLEPVPNKPQIGLPCISDYNRVDRDYVDNQIITEFCNTETFQRITVRAINCNPFAVATVEADVPACGYLGPVPGPAIPPRPWGTATYGMHTTFQFCDIDGREIIVEIEKRDYTGAVKQIEVGGKPACIISPKNIDEIIEPIHPTEMVLQFMSLINNQFDELYTDDDRMFKGTCKYVDTGEIRFKGFLIPSFSSEPFIAPPFPVTLRFTDGLGALSGVTYPIPYGSKTNLRQNFVDILAYALAMTDIDLPIFTQVNLYEAKMANGLDDDPLTQCTVNPLRLSDEKGNIMNCLEVLRNLCRQWTCYIIQSKGAWNFVRIPELSNPVVRRRKYNNEGLFLYSEQSENLITLGNGMMDTQILAPASIEVHNAYKRVAVLHKFGFVPSTIFNGDFEIYDGTTWAYWSMMGGINVSRGQNTVPGVNGAPVLINDYNLTFNEKYDLGKWAQPNNIRVNSGDKLTISFSISSNSPVDIMDHIYLRVILSDGVTTFWLSSPDVAVQNGQLVGVEPVWMNTLQTYSVPIGKGQKSIPSFIYTMNVPQMPISGDITLQIFGFIKRENRVVNIGGVLQDLEYPYEPMSIDNIAMAITNESNTAIPDGVLYISEQQKYYTQSPDLIEVLYGDNVDLFQTTNVTTSANVLQNAISNIYTVDNSFSTLWYEYGLSATKLPIANWAAKSILKLYQRPFRRWEGGILGTFDVTNIFEICFLDGQYYAIMSGSYNMITKQFNNAVLCEIFYKNIPTYDIGMPHNPGQALPPIFNNPNNPVPVAGTRIFTQEFTQEFV